MKTERALVRKPTMQRSMPSYRQRERGVTIILVAFALFAIIAMAALSIDVATLYLARAEAQRLTDTAALTAARVISLSGITGDPNNPATWQRICGGDTSPATLAAKAVASRNAVANDVTSASTNVTVTYKSPTSGPNVDCSALDSAFGINPMVTVQVNRTALPTFFSRMWGRTGASVSATSTAEAFNPSNSGSIAPSGMVSVQPRCVKPWIVPNLDPVNLGFSFVNNVDGSIARPGIRVGGAPPGVIGEAFDLYADCSGSASPCTLRDLTPLVNAFPSPPNLEYLPGELPASFAAVPSCAAGNDYQKAIGGCNQLTTYQCGVPNASATPPNRVDLTENPAGAAGDTATATQCLIHQSGALGQDVLDTSNFPFKIEAGVSNPLISAGFPGNGVISNSSSVVSLPIYDTVSSPIAASNSPITIVGFLQVFINQVNPDGSVHITVLNVAGCGTAATPTSPTVNGSSPVPVRLITPP